MSVYYCTMHIAQVLHFENWVMFIFSDRKTKSGFKISCMCKLTKWREWLHLKTISLCECLAKNYSQNICWNECTFGPWSQCFIHVSIMHLFLYPILNSKMNTHLWFGCSRRLHTNVLVSLIGDNPKHRSFLSIISRVGWFASSWNLIFHILMNGKLWHFCSVRPSVSTVQIMIAEQPSVKFYEATIKLDTRK